MTYVHICSDLKEADFQMRLYLQSHYEEIHKVKRSALIAYMKNGDERHFVPRSRFYAWSRGRREYIIAEDYKWQK